MSDYRPDRVICDKTYTKDGKGCYKCPLYKPCIDEAPMGVMTYEKINENIANKIKLAEEYNEMHPL